MLSRLVGYAAYLFATTSAIRLLTFGVNMLGARIRPKDSYGDYGTYVLFYSNPQGLFIFGVNQAIQTFSVENEENRARYAALAYWLFFLLFGACGVASLGIGLFWNWSYALGLMALPTVVLHWWARYLSRIRLDARAESRLVIVGSLGNSLCQFLFLTLSSLPDALIYGDFLGAVLAGLVAFAVIPSITGFSFTRLRATKIPKDFLRQNFHFAAPLWLSGQIVVIASSIQSVWTRSALGVVALASLNLAMLLWQFAIAPMELITQAALPGLVAAGEERQKMYREIMRMCIVALPAVGVAVAAGIQLILGLVGLREKYWDVPLLLMLTALEVPFRTLQGVTNQLSVADGRPRLSLSAYVAQALVTTAAIYPLSHTYGIFGVVGAGILGTIANALVLVYRLRGHSTEIRTGLSWTLASTAGIVLALVGPAWFRDQPWSWALAFPALLIYLLAMYSVGLWRWSDLQKLKGLYQTRRARASLAS